MDVAAEDAVEVAGEVEVEPEVEVAAGASFLLSLLHFVFLPRLVPHGLKAEGGCKQL